MKAPILVEMCYFLTKQKSRMKIIFPKIRPSSFRSAKFEIIWHQNGRLHVRKSAWICRNLLIWFVQSWLQSLCEIKVTMVFFIV